MGKKSHQTQITRFTDLKWTDWKNGGGQSAQIGIFPDNSIFTANDFQWRVSIAKISTAGPFSVFPGYWRGLTLLQGEGLNLEFLNSGDKKHIRPRDSLSFSGDLKLHATPLSNKEIDWGCIYLPKQVQLRMQNISLKASTRSFVLSARTYFIFVTEGRLTSYEYPGEKIKQLNTLDFARMENPYFTDKSREYIISLEAKDPATQISILELSY